MKTKTYLLSVFILISIALSAQKQAGLLLTKESIPELQEAISTYPLWEENTSMLKATVDEIIASPIDVPVPVDPAGGYTHKQHKRNGKNLQKLGAAYQLFGNDDYALYAKNLFIAYSEKYSTFGEHPIKKSYAPGILFWQQLNEAVWLVDAIQGYDAIYDYLSKEERKQIEEELLLPFADFVSIKNAKVFNRIHNHGVWAVAAVGMTGIALENDELICRALYGINSKGKPNYNKIDKDKLEEYGTGFFVQTKALFSPDGYYTEGPYYQRYAMTPFLLFAQSMHNNVPELQSLSYRDGIFFKAVETLIELADTKGNFLPINDNLKGMNLNAPELVWAVDFLYAHTKNPELLSIVSNHKYVLVNNLGLEVVKGLSNNLQEPLKQVSKLITDGSDGNFGGIMLLRDSANEFCSVFKFASQGLTHGHYDRLNLFHYHQGNEVLTDYGSARFVNVKAKEGGRYLPENESYAKQSIAHNTVVINEETHFNFNYKDAEKYHPEQIFQSINQEPLQLVCARDTNAYPGVNMTRVVGQFTHEDFTNPIVIDLFQVNNTTGNNQYDLPFHFTGQLIDTDFDYHAESSTQSALGQANGYQHLWKQASGTDSNSTSGFTWLANNYVYSVSTAVNNNTELIFAQIGANDPNFNLRNEPVFIVREKNKENHTFASIVECHGKQNPETESVSGQSKQITKTEVLVSNKKYIAFTFSNDAGHQFILMVNLEKEDVNKKHELMVESKNYQWVGNYKLVQL